MIIRNGNIHDAVNREAYVADIKIENGKISEIGENIIPEKDEEIIDASGMEVFPGLVEAHCHLGLESYGQGNMGIDVNERNDIISAHLRGIDGFNPFDKNVRFALEGGVTTVAAGPGSASVVGGTFIAVKTYGVCVDEMIIKNDIAMKCAFGENPKRIYESKCDSSRMTTAAKLREVLFNTREYLAKKEAAGSDASKMPKFDMKLEAMIPVIKGEIPLKAHAHRADDICTAIRIAKEFGVKMTLEHATEGHLVTEQIVKSGFPCAVGPTMTNSIKLELANKTFETAGILQRAGVKVSIITDSPVTQQYYLGICAGLAVKDGMDEFEALKAITINPAEHIGVSDRVGSVEVGKDADIVISDGNIMVSDTKIHKVIVDGKIVVEK